jgi:photosystem II stability/assembly factor-like uncharacterized protein
MPMTTCLRGLVLTFSFSLIAAAFAPAANSAKGSDGNVPFVSVTLTGTPRTSDLTDISFSAAGVGYASGGFGTVLKSTNNGRSWQQLSTGIREGFSSIFAIDDDDVFVGGAAELYRSSDGGGSWSAVGLGPSGSRIFGIYFTSAREGVVQKNGGLLHSADGGHTWAHASDDLAYRTYCYLFSFPDSSIGYCAGGYTGVGILPGSPRTSLGDLTKTVDGGQHWSRLKLRTTEIRGIYFLSPTSGYICNVDGEIYKTTDGGATWNLIGHNAPCWSVIFR